MKKVTKTAILFIVTLFVTVGLFKSVDVMAEDYILGREMTDEEIEEQLNMIPKNLEPLPVDMEGLRSNTNPFAAARLLGLDETQDVSPSLEAQYDLRDEGICPAVRNQGQFGCCWAFATLASFEGSLVRTGIVDADKVDLSEFHLAYYAYHTGSDQFGNTDDDYIDYTNTEKNGLLYLYNGGNCQRSTVALMNGKGAANESLWRYYPDDASAMKTQDTEIAKNTDNAWNSDVYRLTSVSFISAYNENTDILDKNVVKAAVKSYGILYTDMYFDTGINMTKYYKASTGAYYYSEAGASASMVNHAVCIVGWDDNYSADNFATRPAGNGAWIVRNSWGADFADGGYNYVSYYDAVFAKNSIAAFRGRKADASENLYYYSGGAFSGSYYPECDGLAQAITAEGCEGGSERIKSVGVYVLSDDVSFSVQIYKPTLSGGIVVNPKSGTALLTKPVTGYITMSGYYDIQIPEDVIIDEGDTITVVVDFDHDIALPLDVSGDCGSNFRNISYAAASEGETFISIGGRYSDAAETFSDGAGGVTPVTMRINIITTDVGDDVYTVKFDGNGATSGSMEDLICNSDSLYDLPENEFAKTGYTFTGWNTAADGNGTAYSDEASVSNLALAGESVTLYAQWSENSYTLKLFGEEEDAPLVEVQLTYTEEYTIPECTETRTGYTFTGWNTLVNGTGTMYQPGEDVSKLAAEDGVTVELYAQWREHTYTVIFLGNGATSGSTIECTLRYNQILKFPECPFTKTGYTFEYWNLKSDGSDDKKYYIMSEGFQFTAEDGAIVEFYAIWSENSYTLKLYGNEPTTGSTVTVSLMYTQTYELPECHFTKSGYKFIGWNTKKDGTGTMYQPGETVSKLIAKDEANFALYAQWEEDSYTVKFDGNGATSGSMEALKYNLVSTYTLPANMFAKTGFTFTGWNTSADGTGTAFEDEASVSNLALAGESVTLYAQWSENSYTLKLYGNDQTTGNTLLVTLSYTETYELPECHFTKTGYKFTGWNAKKDGTGKMYQPGEKVSKLSATDGALKALYAQWEEISYTLNCNSNGGTGGGEQKQLTYTEEYTLPACTFIKTGYTFTGWNTESDGSGTMYQPGNTVSKLTVEDDATIELYAQWEENSYTLKLHANGAVGSPIEKQLTYTEEYTLPACTFIKTGYTFTGWNTESDGSGTMYQAGNTVSKLTAEDNATFTLYAQWRENSYTLKLHANGAVGSTIEKHLTYAQEYILPACTFIKTGYTFTGWNTESDGSGTMYQPGNTVSELAAEDDATIELYAQWRENSYTLKLYANGATGTTITKKLTYTQEYELPECTFVMAGYTFTGWNTQKTGSGTMYQPGRTVSGLTVKDGVNVALYAQWKENSYTVKFDGNSATSGSMSDLKYNLDSTYTLPVNRFAKTGYTFTGWNTKSDGTGTAYADEAPVNNLASAGGTVTLYAQWRENSYTLKLYGNDQTTGNTLSIPLTYTESYELPGCHFTKKGYTFIGWNTKKDGSGKMYQPGNTVSKLTVKDGGAVALYAQWEEAQAETHYTLKLYGNGAVSGKTIKAELAYTEEYVLPTNPFIWPGYKFTGWNTKINGSGKMYQPGDTVSRLTAKDGGAIALYAQWEESQEETHYTLKLYGNGALSGKTIKAELAYTEEYVLPANPFVWPGYKFTGWNTKTDGTGKMYQSGDTVSKLSVKDGGAVALYAQWEEGEETYYTLKLYGNGAVSGSTVKVQLSYTEEYALPINPFTWPGYEFVGWNTKKDGTGTMYQPGDTVSKLTVKEATALYAIWVPQ